MSWDQPVHSFNFPNGEPQTPTRASGTTSFQTPKFESSFFDPRVTWDTSDPYASSPEFLRTPQKFGLATPSNPSRRPDTVHDGHHPASARKAAVAAVGDTDTAKRLRQLKPNGTDEPEALPLAHSAKSAASMQTPPPTSASMRKASQDEFAACSARRFSTAGGHLARPSRLLEASPRMFGNLQSSPDLFQLAAADPTASSFFSQQIFPWDQDLEQPRSGGGMPGTSVGLFPSQGTITTDPAMLNDAQHTENSEIRGPSDLAYGENAFGFMPQDPSDAALFPAPFSTSPRLAVPKADDPALFLSSPARRFGGPPLSPQRQHPHHQQRKGPSRPPRQPYHHQMEESRRDELWRAQRLNGTTDLGALALDGDDEDDPDDDYTPRQVRVRPGLTRSFTHTAVTGSSHRASSLSQSSFSGMMASTNGVRKSPTKGRSSPIKTMRQPLPRANSVATGFPTRSQSVVLKIGKDGRAKTEMRIVNAGDSGLTDPVFGMELDGSGSTTETDDSDYSAEYPNYPILHSHNPSFALPDAGGPTLSRSESGSRPHSKGSYASTVSSSQSAGRGSPWAPGSSRGAGRRSSVRPPSGDWKKTPKRHSMAINSDFSVGSSVSAAPKSGPVPEDDSGDAQHALRQVLKGRARTSTAGYGARPSRASCSFTHLRSSPPRFGSELESSTSPTTVTDPDLATPSTDRLRNPSKGTRCVCNSLDNGGHLMIQCESCCHWLHTKCIGLGRANLPSAYVCIFCIQTPSRRDRLRKDPLASTGHAQTSPLAHKSFRSR